MERLCAWLIVVSLQLACGVAQACMFARDAQPKDWDAWADALFAADVSGVEREKTLDVITLRVVETFKGPPNAATARLQVPSRLWRSCNLPRPSAGERVLVALNPGGDTLVVPLSAGYTEQLREYRSRKQ